MAGKTQAERIKTLQAEVSRLRVHLKLAASKRLAPLCTQHLVPMRCPACIGSIKSEARAAASRANGLLGGTPHNLRGGRRKKEVA